MADKATALAKTTGMDRQRALIHALQLGYRNGSGGKPGDLAFAKAMTTLAARYPADDEIAVMAADAWLMTEANTPEGWKPNVQVAMPLLETVLNRWPDYTPAIHFYIHAIEAAGMPALAERWPSAMPTPRTANAKSTIGGLTDAFNVRLADTP